MRYTIATSTLPEGWTGPTLRDAVGFDPAGDFRAGVDEVVVDSTLEPTAFAAAVDAYEAPARLRMEDVALEMPEDVWTLRWDDESQLSEPIDYIEAESFTGGVFIVERTYYRVADLQHSAALELEPKAGVAPLVSSLRTFVDGPFGPVQRADEHRMYRTDGTWITKSIPNARRYNRTEQAKRGKQRREDAVEDLKGQIGVACTALGISAADVLAAVLPVQPVFIEGADPSMVVSAVATWPQIQALVSNRLAYWIQE